MLLNMYIHWDMTQNIARVQGVVPFPTNYYLLTKNITSIKSMFLASIYPESMYL